ncbi:MAG: FAD-dependent oxidoreductase [Saprospiraceae bacterium]|nr:FAD-dependent oxidoreductase [Saprospiraceae bacterium]
MKKILIVGQGIAGTVLAWTLQGLGQDVYVMDAPDQQTLSASQVAAGIINPVTGKRFAKSWMFETLFAHARACYLQLEVQLGVQIWQDLRIERMLQQPEELNNWSLRSHAPDFSSFLSDAEQTGQWQPFAQPNHLFGVIHHAARVRFETLLPVFRQQLLLAGRLIQQRFDYQDLDKFALDFELLLFCEGYSGISHPLFQHLGWNVTKGEAFHIAMEGNEGLPSSEILKKGALIAPLEPGKYWVGSTNEWTFTDALPSATGHAWLKNNLEHMLKTPYQVKTHLAAIRPTVKDRRPLIGTHPQFPKLGIFNGLGTKGALLAPYWAQHFAQHLLQGTLLDPQVDIRRFSA